MANVKRSVKFDESGMLSDYNGYATRCKEAKEELAAELKRKHPSDPLAGEIIRFSIADGYAEYMVEKGTTLLHLHEGDGYAALPATIRGLRRRDIENMVDMEIDLKILLSEQREGR